VTATDATAPGEFELIAKYFRRPVSDPSVLIGSGDDAAVVAPSQPLAISTDTLVAGVHFLASADPARLAERALAVNLSDMAAMGAQPRWFTLALTLPRVEARWLENFSDGLYACASRYDVALIGGDVTAGPLCLSIHIIGEVAADQVLRRSGASSGDGVFVTGSPGDAAAGLEIASQGAALTADTQFLVDRFELPVPRVGAGLALRGIASAAIDISDGLLADLGRLCAASDVGACIDVEKLPVSAPLQRVVGMEQAREFALSGGDDYELCFTAPLRAADDLPDLFSHLELAVTRIGVCRDGAGVDCLLDGEPWTPSRRGYEHFT
jgi:thiamine-monophosphate kinase